MDKKEITEKTTVKALITGFVSYGIITVFICWLLLLIGNSILNNFKGSTAKGLYITLPLMAVICIYCIIHMVCRMSTYDVFKKCKTNPENYKNINKFLNVFFLIVIFLSIATFLSLLYLNLQVQLKSIELATLQYKQIFSEKHVALLSDDMNNTYNESRTNLIISTIILEIGCAISFLSLIPYQRKMILKYNEY